jgi:4-amino-4-deoxy-L-arabinose transferase-like glycosyltransferase
MPTQITQDISPGKGSLGWGAAVVTASLAFSIFFSFYVLMRPPLFNYDGYTYRLEALQPLQGENVNPHHLLWYPVQKGIAALTSALGSPSPEAFQLFGILINSLTLALLCLLLVRLTHRRALALVMTVFIAFSPHIWSLGLQNQPYPLLDLCIVAFLWAVAEWSTPSRLRWAASGLALAGAVLLQQAMALAVPAVAIGFIAAGAGRWTGRWWRAAAWAGCITLGVAAVYGLMARAAGVEPAGFFTWTLEYMQDQHGIQVQWPQTAIKCVIGMVGTVVESSWIHERFNPQANNDAVWRLYGTLLLAGGVAAVVLISRRSVRERLIRLLRSNASFTSVLMMVLAWSGFVFLWEPTGHFWGVMLFPLAFLASWWVRVIRKRTALAVAAVLLVVSGWNLHANHRQDQAYSVNFPPPMLEQIRAELGPHDVFIVAGRDWYANRDYGLLLECLDDWPRDPAMALLDEYVMKGSQEEWQQKLDLDIRAAFTAGGRVYVADHVFWPDSYRDLEQTADPFSAYAHMEYAGLAGASLTGKIKRFFGRYKLYPSSFKIGTDPFWELKPIE